MLNRTLVKCKVKTYIENKTYHGVLSEYLENITLNKLHTIFMESTYSKPLQLLAYRYLSIAAQTAAVSHGKNMTPGSYFCHDPKVYDISNIIEVKLFLIMKLGKIWA